MIWRATILLAGALSSAATASGPADRAKPASPATIAAQRSAAASLPSDDGRDAEFARRGFIGTRSEPLITAADGRTVWNLDAYRFVDGPAPDTVHPSLWRHMGLLKAHGLFQAAEGVWQVRGFDVSNMTLLAGQTGWIVIDPLTSRETAAAALELANARLGTRPVVAVIYSHSHADHFGGVRGVVDEKDVAAGKVRILAPEGFSEEAASENVLAGAAMTRRAGYQFGTALGAGPTGAIGSGIGPGLPTGETTLIAPTQTIRRTGERLIIDGVELEFQIVSGTEAPAEFNVFIAPAKTFLAAEIATCSLHNILTPRGAKVRDAHRWAEVLDEALRLYAPRSEAVISSHCWPRFGGAEVAAWLTGHRDNYRHLHDQTVRAMNRGATIQELPELVQQPAELAGQWANRGYYGTYSHNTRAVYQHYLGWYDGVPANLDPLPPADRARRYVAAMGGGRKVLGLARGALAAGDYRWSSDLLNNLIFAEPGNTAARELLADSYEQQGYQAESAIWRNQFLSAARELRGGGPAPGRSAQNADMISAVPTRLLLDSVATRYAPQAQRLAINLEISDRGERVGIEAGPAAMIARTGVPLADPQATVTAPRRLILGLLMLKLPLESLEAAGLKVQGDREAVFRLQGALDPLPGPFNIVEP